MLWARLNRGGPCGGVSWRRPVLTVTVTVQRIRLYFIVYLGAIIHLVITLIHTHQKHYVLSMGTLL